MEGTVKWTFLDDKYPENSKHIIQFDRIQHYPQSEGMWNDHYVIKTAFGIYIILFDKDKYNEPSPVE